MKRKNSYHINIGGASILLVIAVFALTVFAILSLRASYHEVKMSEKTRNAIQEYYTADSRAEEILMQISEVVAKQDSSLDIAKLSQDLSIIDKLKIDKSTHILTYNVPVNYNKDLEISLKLPTKMDEGVTVHSWKMVLTELGDYNDSSMEDIWDGILDE